jgi:hypothetical protein
MTPEEKAVLDLLEGWSPDVTGLLHRAGYFDLPAGTKKDEIANKVGFGRGTPLWKKLRDSSLEKNRQVSAIVINEQNLIELKQGARQVATQLGLEFSEFDWDPISQKYMKEEGFKLVKTLTQTDLKRIVPIMQQHFGLNERTFAKRFRDNYPCSEYRMRTIFRTEKFTAINGGAHGLAVEAGATIKTWRHSHGPNPRKDHLAMDGEEQPIDKPFSNGKQFPGNDPNCRCRADYGF